jgi:hypothetical protein
MDWIYANDIDFVNIESNTYYDGYMLLKQGDQTLYRFGISHRYFDINIKDA